VKKLLLEGLVVAVIGAALSFAANEISPLGLKLTRNYFPGSTPSSPPVTASGNPSQGSADTNAHAPSYFELLAARLKEHGLGVVDSNQVAQLLKDPRAEQDLILFIDARNDEHYQAGHIPGAYQFDHYHPEKYLPAVMPVCQRAQQIVVYCAGGECEDSESAAIFLAQAGIPKERLFVYGGGWTEWTNAMPYEAGSRKSGDLRSARK